MRRLVASSLLALAALLLFGCGQASNPPVSPGPRLGSGGQRGGRCLGDHQSDQRGTGRPPRRAEE